MLPENVHFLFRPSWIMLGFIPFQHYSYKSLRNIQDVTICSSVLLTITVIRSDYTKDPGKTTEKSPSQVPPSPQPQIDTPRHLGHDVANAISLSIFDTL